MRTFRAIAIVVCVTSLACGSGGNTATDAGSDGPPAVDSSGDAVSGEAGGDALAADAGDAAAPTPTPLAVCPKATKATRYVSPSGSDGNSGSSTSPFATIQHAIDVSGAGDVVHVLAGTYSGTASPLAYVRSSTSGTASEPVVFCSDPPGAAKLDGQNVLTTGFYLEGSYVHVLGFEITRFAGNGVSVWATGGALVGNDIHDIGHVCDDSDLGKDGIYVTATNVTIDANVIHTIGRLSPGEQGCNPSTANYQNHDHGIYVESSTNVVITNNVMYDNQHGWDIHVYSSSGPGSSGLTIANNTFAFANPYRDGQVLLSTPGVSTSVVENNVFYEPQTEGLHFGSGGSYSSITVQGNVTTGAVTTATSPGGSVVVSGNSDDTDALLVSPTTFDFHLQATSPAVDHGLSIGAVTTDIAGTPRPQGSAYDIGAYEWH
jgi:parallel beta-helix repeat protein